jgi:hypothetical protein
MGSDSDISIFRALHCIYPWWPSSPHASLKMLRPPAVARLHLSRSRRGLPEGCDKGTPFLIMTQLRVWTLRRSVFLDPRLRLGGQSSPYYWQPRASSHLSAERVPNRVSQKSNQSLMGRRCPRPRRLSAGWPRALQALGDAGPRIHFSSFSCPRPSLGWRCFTFSPHLLSIPSGASCLIGRIIGAGGKCNTGTSDVVSSVLQRNRATPPSDEVSPCVLDDFFYSYWGKRNGLISRIEECIKLRGGTHEVTQIQGTTL